MRYGLPVYGTQLGCDSFNTAGAEHRHGVGASSSAPRRCRALRCKVYEIQ